MIPPAKEALTAINSSQTSISGNQTKFWPLAGFIAFSKETTFIKSLFARPNGTNVLLILLFDVDRDIVDNTNDGETRLSWYLNQQNHGGYRCGTTRVLYNSNLGGDDWEKVFFHAN